MKIFFALILLHFSACQKMNDLNSGNQKNKLARELIWDMTVDSRGLSNTKALVHTSKGDFVMKFYTLLAPKSSERIINLIQDGYFNRGNVSRAFKNYIVQFGGPNKRTSNEGAQDHLFEFNSVQHIRGSVGLVIQDTKDWENENPEFYISLTTLPHLDRRFTVFGQIIEGLDVAEKLQTNDAILNIELKN